MCFAVGVYWGMTKGTVPRWVGASFSAVLGYLAVRACFAQGVAWSLDLIESINLLMAAILLAFVFRRLSPGTVLSVLGFVAWSLSCLRSLPWVTQNTVLGLNFMSVIVMAKVVAAVGMILLTLEDELDRNQAAEDRERQVRHQLEAYAGLILTRRRVEDFDRQGAEICQIVVQHSRFAQAALLLESGGPSA